MLTSRKLGAVFFLVETGQIDSIRDIFQRDRYCRIQITDNTQIIHAAIGALQVEVVKFILEKKGRAVTNLWPRVDLFDSESITKKKQDIKWLLYQYSQTIPEKFWKDYTLWRRKIVLLLYRKFENLDLAFEISTFYFRK